MLLALWKGFFYTSFMKLPKQTLIQLKVLLWQDERIAAAYLLGSAASGRMRPDSDIDVAILPVQGLSFTSLDRAELAGRLSYELGRSVDMGLLSSANLVYSRQVLEKGARLFMKNPLYVQLMETTLLSMYLWFNEERKELLHAYRNR